MKAWPRCSCSCPVHWETCRRVGSCSSVPAQMAAAPAAAAPDALLIAHSDAENARMDAEMDGLGEPLLKWYKIVRYAHQPTFERKNGQLRLVAHASALETYAPFWMIKAEGGDLFCTCALCPPGTDTVRRLTQKKSKDDPTRKLSMQKLIEHLRNATSTGPSSNRTSPSCTKQLASSSVRAFTRWAMSVITASWAGFSANIERVSILTTTRCSC